jgi:hypothetical protein
MPSAAFVAVTVYLPDEIIGNITCPISSVVPVSTVLFMDVAPADTPNNVSIQLVFDTVDDDITATIVTFFCGLPYLSKKRMVTSFGYSELRLAFVPDSTAFTIGIVTALSASTTYEALLLVYPVDDAYSTTMLYGYECENTPVVVVVL